MASSEVTALTGGGGALILAIPAPERPWVADLMGSEVVSFVVGVPGNEKVFTIHANLLIQAGGTFKVFVENQLQATPAGHRVRFEKEEPAVFRLFVETLYTRQVPAVPAVTSAKESQMAAAQRLRDLCKLYAMVDKFDVKVTLRNMIMDRIQDGFVTINRFPERPLILGIYLHTRKDSHLRKFLAGCLVAHLRTPEFIDEIGLDEMLEKSEDIRCDFISAVRYFQMGRDPRVRDCHGEEGGCLVCVAGPGHSPLREGLHPCTFHHHPKAIKEEDKDDGGASLEAFPDKGCHLWPATHHTYHTTA